MRNFLLVVMSMIGLTAFSQTHTLDMLDSFGDGWNGGTVTIEGVTYDLDTYDATGDGEEGSVDVTILDPSCIVAIVTAGNYESEMSFTLTDISTGDVVIDWSGAGWFVSSGTTQEVQTLGCPILGCTDANATNFDSTADTDDGSCLFSQAYVDSNSGGSMNCQAIADSLFFALQDIDDLTAGIDILIDSVNYWEGTANYWENNHSTLLANMPDCSDISDSLFQATAAWDYWQNLAEAQQINLANQVDINNQLSDQISTLGTQVTLLTIDLDYCNDNTTVLLDSLAYLNGLVANFGNLNNTIVILQADLDQANQTILALNQNITVLNTQLNTADDNLDICNDNLQDYVSAYNWAHGLSQDLTIQLDECNDNNSLLNQMLDDCNESLNDCLDGTTSSVIENDGFGCIDCGEVEMYLNELGQQIDPEDYKGTLITVYKSGHVTKTRLF